MKKFRWWAFWRRMQYGAGTLVFFVLVGAVVYRTYIYTPGSCFDNIMNQTERGVDCGGTCVRICTVEVTPPKILWAQSFEVVSGQYNAVAYVENNNQLAATPALAYTFEFFNGTTKIGERTGTTVLPPSSIYPIFEGRILTDGQPITNTTLTLKSADMWVPATVGRGQFKTTTIDLKNIDVQPRLDVTLENTELSDANNIEVVATLFNAAGKPITASQTFIDSLSGRSQKDIVFTWPQPLTKTIRSCEVPSDIILGIDLSGSMNSDGGTPPQPITDALAAAKQFVTTLKSADKAAVVSFATQAATVVELTGSHITTAETIERLTIQPADEVGFTNTPAAFAAAQTEFISGRHRADSRRALILLTDGLPTAPGDKTTIVEEAKVAAKALSDSGVSIYAIGLGAGVNTEFIESIASSKEQAFLAPTTADLSRIYGAITGSLCESGATRIDVIAKTGANFTPLR